MLRCSALPRQLCSRATSRRSAILPWKRKQVDRRRRLDVLEVMPESTDLCGLGCPSSTKPCGIHQTMPESRCLCGTGNASCRRPSWSCPSSLRRRTIDTDIHQNCSKGSWKLVAGGALFCRFLEANGPVLPKAHSKCGVLIVSRCTEGLRARSITCQLLEELVMFLLRH